MGVCGILPLVLWVAVVVALLRRPAMWSHVILPMTAPPPPGFRLYWTNRKTWRLATNHQEAYISPAGDYDPASGAEAWDWHDNLAVPYCGDTFVDDAGYVWLYGYLSWTFGTPADNNQFWAARWDRDTRQMIRAWSVDRPASRTFGSHTQTWGGIISICPAYDAGFLYAVVGNPTTLGPASWVRSGVIVKTNARTDGTASSVQDTVDTNKWTRDAVLVGDLYGAQTLISDPDWDGISTPLFSGLVDSILDVHDGVHSVDYTFGLAQGTVIVYLDEDPFFVQTDQVCGLVRSGADTADDATSWGALLALYSRIDLSVQTTDNYGLLFGPIRRSYLQMFHFGGRQWWSWGFCWDTATTSATPHNATTVWCRLDDGLTSEIRESFVLPAASLSGQTCHWGGLLAICGADLWMATVEGFSVDDPRSSAILRLWKFVFDPGGDPDGDYWDNVINLERPTGDWDGPTVASMAMDPDGKVHILMDPGVSESGVLLNVEEIIYDPAAAPPIFPGDPDPRWTYVEHGPPDGTWTLNGPRRLIEWET